MTEALPLHSPWMDTRFMKAQFQILQCKIWKANRENVSFEATMFGGSGLRMQFFCGLCTGLEIHNQSSRLERYTCQDWPQPPNLKSQTLNPKPYLNPKTHTLNNKSETLDSIKTSTPGLRKPRDKNINFKFNFTNGLKFKTLHPKPYTLPRKP